MTTRTTEPIDEAEADRLANLSLILVGVWLVVVVSLKFIAYGRVGGFGPFLVIAICVGAPVAAIRWAARARRSGHVGGKAILASVLGWTELVLTIGSVLYVGILIWLFAHSDFTF